MYISYAVVFQNTETKKVKMDVFTARTVAEARHCFFECYRHGSYNILSVTAIPE